jgi:hypothetical protein
MGMDVASNAWIQAMKSVIDRALAEREGGRERKKRKGKTETEGGVEDLPEAIGNLLRERGGGSKEKRENGGGGVEDLREAIGFRV